MRGVSANCQCPPMLTDICPHSCSFMPTSFCSATACCSACIEPCGGNLSPPRPLPATACVTVCSVCKPPACPQPCRLCPIVRCSKMLFVAPPHRRGYARYVPPTSCIPKQTKCNMCLSTSSFGGIARQPPMRFSLSTCGRHSHIRRC